MYPGPRPVPGVDRPSAGRGRTGHRPNRAGLHPEPTGPRADRPSADLPVAEAPAGATGCGPAPAVVLTRTPQGWSVVSPQGAEPVADLVEGMSLADLVSEEYGGAPDPDRRARRSARGNGREGSGPAVAGAADPVAERIAALERTVAQLEHALAARVAIERAVGVLAERQGSTPQEAFDALRGRARSQSRPVHELAREVLDELAARAVAHASGGRPADLHAVGDQHACGRGRTDRPGRLPAAADGRS